MHALYANNADNNTDSRAENEKKVNKIAHLICIFAYVATHGNIIDGQSNYLIILFYVRIELLYLWI